MQTQNITFSRASRVGIAAVVIAILGAAGCVSTTPGAHPEDMSTAEHLNAAAHEEQLAEEEAERYDPSATVYRTGPAHGPEGGYLDSEYNPTSRHLAQAREHERHAADHRAAAVALEHFEEAQCRSFPPAVRVACPLLGQLESAQNIEGGVRLTFMDDVNVQAATDHVLCHLAFGRTRGFEGMPNCPLYLPGLHVNPLPESHALELTADDPEVVIELRRRAATHVEPEAS